MSQILAHFYPRTEIEPESHTREIWLSSKMDFERPQLGKGVVVCLSSMAQTVRTVVCCRALYVPTVLFPDRFLCPCDRNSLPARIYQYGQEICQLTTGPLSLDFGDPPGSSLLQLELGPATEISYRDLIQFRTVTWLILPVVICLSQRLSHACPSTSLTKVKPRMAH